MPELSKTAAVSSGPNPWCAARSYPGGRTLIDPIVVAAVVGLVLSWSRLAATGVAPLFLSAPASPATRSSPQAGHRRRRRDERPRIGIFTSPQETSLFIVPSR